jgi:hypothetical protein
MITTAPRVTPQHWCDRMKLKFLFTVPLAEALIQDFFAEWTIVSSSGYEPKSIHVFFFKTD